MDQFHEDVDAREGLDSVAFRTGFLDTLVEGILLVNQEGVIVDCNRAAGEILLIDAHDLVGVDIFKPQLGYTIGDGSPLSREEHPVMVTLRDGKPAAGVTVGVDLPTARRWLSITTSPCTVKHQSRGAVVRFTDITAQVWRERNFQFLLHVNRLMVSSTGTSEFLERLCTAFVELGRCALAAVSVGDSDNLGDVKIPFAAGATDFLYEGIVSWSGSSKLGLGPTGTALRTRNTQVANLLGDLPDYAPWQERAQRFGFNSLAAIPFTLGQQLAVLTLISIHPHAFDQSALDGLEGVAREIEFGVSHFQSAEKLARSLNGTLAALGQMTETRDPYTAGHQIRVGALGAAIAARLGMDSNMTDLVRQSGEVHDVGKIGVPAEILTRPGRLSTLDFEMVKSHTTAGANILAKASLPWPITEVALQHHERIDGSGYPNGLRGGEIIQPARIIAVADVVEAMTHHRPYRAGLGIDVALAEIVRGAGSLYDAEVVEACIAAFEAGFTFESAGDGRTTR